MSLPTTAYISIFKLILVTVNACAIRKCPTGSQCKVYQPTGKAFCEPSCDLDNGGCPANQDCSLVPAICPGPPCPPVVKCTPPIHSK